MYGIDIQYFPACLKICLILYKLFIYFGYEFLIGYMDLPYGSGGKGSACNTGDLGSILGLRRNLEKGKATPPVFWPGEFHGLHRPGGHKESDTTERLSLTWLCYLQIFSPIQHVVFLIFLNFTGV